MICHVFRNYNQIYFEERDFLVERFNFYSCNDPILDNLNKQLEELKEAVKSRQEMLKTIKGHMLVSFPDPETGELIENHEIYPPSLTSTTTYKTELLKD